MISLRTSLLFIAGPRENTGCQAAVEEPMKLPSGQELKEAYFIFDNAADIMTSKHWIKIQRPYLSRERTREGFQGKYGAVREVTAIIEEDKRSYP